jgi:excisionase family DNA binding protein
MTKRSGRSLNQNDVPEQASLPLMTITEVAELFVVCERTVRNWVKEGLLHPIKIGGSLRFRRSEIEALLNKPTGM